MNRYHLLLVSALLLLLAACGQNTQPAASAPGFSFNVDPAAGSVELEALSSELAAAIVAECDNGTRTLTPGDELKLSDYKFAFLPGNVLEITTAFTNTTDFTFEQPFAFSSTSVTNNVASTTEPEVTDADLGGDGKLSPDEETNVLTFKVEHTGQAFTYEVSAQADVSCTGEPVEEPESAATLYTDCDFSGASFSLAVGDYTTDDLAALGIKDDDASSIQITPGFRVEMFDNDNFGGDSLSLTSDDNCFVNDSFNDRLSSIRITRADDPLPADASLSLSKSDGGVTATPGDTVIYTLNYENTSDFDSSPAFITETVPENTVFSKEASGDSEWLCADASEENAKCTLDLGVIPANTPGSVTFAVMVDKPIAEGVSEIENTATIQDGSLNKEGEPEVDDTASDTTPVVFEIGLNAALSLTKSDDDEAVMPGDTIVYTLGYENTSDFASKAAFITETVPEYTTFNEAASDVGWSCEEGTCTLDLGIIPALESGSATFAVTVDKPLDEEVIEVSNTATIQDQPGEEVDSTDTEATPIVRQDVCVGPVNIPDSGLQQAIRNQLGKQEGELTCDDLASLQSLNAYVSINGSYAKINSLEGLQFATNLILLYVYNDERSDLSDISPLSELTSLQTLYLANNSVSDIGPLVTNSDIGDGSDQIYLSYNCLNLSAGSQAQQDVVTLEDRNPDQQNIYAEPQGNAQCPV